MLFKDWLINLFAIFKKLSFVKAITLVTLIASIVTFGLFAQVGNLGGQIRHSEIRTDSNINQGYNENSQNTETQDNDDD